MRISLRGGGEIRRDIDAPPGSTLAPLSRAQHLDQFRRWMMGAWTPAQQQELIDGVEAIDGQQDTDAIDGLIRKARAPAAGG